LSVVSARVVRLGRTHRGHWQLVRPAHDLLHRRTSLVVDRLRGWLAVVRLRWGLLVTVTRPLGLAEVVRGEGF
jgi:hypothetical protein